MKFIDINGLLGRGRRYVSSFTSPSAEQLEDKYKLAETIRDLTARINTLEAKSAPEGIEFEVDATAGTDMEFHHNFGCPVRWYVVDWWHTIGSGHNSLHRTAASTDNVLVLHSHNSGRMVLRIEPSQYGLTKSLN